MLQETRLRIVDNSGGKLAKLIRPGFINLVRLVKVFPSKKVKKGEIYTSCLILSKINLKRHSGINLRHNSNDILLLKKDLSLVGSRIYRPVPIELKYRGLSKVTSFANSLY